MFRREASGRRLARVLVTAGLFAASLLRSPRARAQDAAPQTGWSGEIRTEPSAVRIEGRDVSWWYNHAEVQYHAENKDIVYLGGETQTRDDVTNGMVILGGYAHRGDWYYFGEARAGIDPTFLYQVSLEAQAGRLFHHTLVSLDYRFLDFKTTDVHLGTGSVTQSFGWGEVEARVAYGENVALGKPIRMALLRALWFATPQLWIGGGAAVGTRLFDVVAIQLAQENGWTAFANASYQWTDRDRVRIDFGYSRENPSFRQVGGALSYRRRF